ncbi:MAG: filamentous hemagglutinin N-terminal domain-containing protein, partial [Pirellulales bacterium]
MLWANPTGADVVAGSAAINAQGNTLNVVTGSDRTIINWQDFSIGANEATNFIQPGANSAVLNRVTGGNASAIYGQLNSNGNVFLINPNGIFIGPGGVINVNGFTASTFDITNKDFLDGAPFNFQGSSLESVINEGRIQTGAGGAALLGHQVINNGTITSEGGAITLATGGSITLGDGSRYIQADINTLTNGLSETAALIKQSGTVRATGALKTGGEVYLVNPNGNIMHNGTIQADKLADSGARTGGSVKLEAKQGTTTVAGAIDVSGETGGSVQVLGKHVELASANIDASGTTGGGEVLVGGDLRGGNPEVLNALSTKVDAASQVNVDSIESGNAGRAIYYAEDATEYYGHTSAAARGATGDGGFIEVSGEDLVFNGSVDLASAGGEVGTVLLDPAVFNANAGNIVSLRNAWGSGHLVIEADNAINIREDLYPAIGGAEIVAGTSNNLTLREESGAGFDGGVNILIDATIRNGNNTTSVGSQYYYAGNGDFSISADGSIEGRSFVQIQSATIDLQGPINNNSSRYFTATNNADIGIGTDAVGTWKLDDDELAFITTNSHFNSFTGNGHVDVNMTNANAFLGSVEFYVPNHDVTLNEFHGRNLSVYARNLSILGPVVGSSTFSYQQGGGRTLGVGDDAAGDVILDQATIDQLSGFSRFSVGSTSSSGTALDVHNADLSAFTSTELRGSEITIDGLTVNQNL